MDHGSLDQKGSWKKLLHIEMSLFPLFLGHRQVVASLLMMFWYMSLTQTSLKTEATPTPPRMDPRKYWTLNSVVTTSDFAPLDKQDSCSAGDCLFI